MTRFFSSLMLALAVFGAGSAFATPVLSLDRVTAAEILGGQTALFELRITNSSDVVGAFSLDIHFDASVLGFRPAATPAAQFGVHLGDPLLETIGTADVSSPGLLHLDQVSLLDSPSLNALQRDAGGQLLSAFVLAQLTFEGLAPGVGALDFVTSSITFSDDSGQVSTQPVVGTVDQLSVVSEPGSIGLASLCLLAVFSACRRTSRRSMA